jgi:hypothetical protein
MEAESGLGRGIRGIFPPDPFPSALSPQCKQGGGGLQKPAKGQQPAQCGAGTHSPADAFLPLGFANACTLSETQCTNG